MSAQPKNIDRSKVVEIVNSVISKIEGQGVVQRDTIFRELNDLSQIIEQTRADIAQTGADQISTSHIPSATDELDAVVEATANATGSIMTACENMERELAKHPGELANVVQDQITGIYEACTFQDITGQRIRKVVKLLQEIENKVSHVMTILGGDQVESTGTAPAKDTREGDEKLLNGPQMSGKGVSQEDIDKLLNDF